MWVATSFGFLMPAIRPPHTVKFGDSRTLQVRARRAKDLDILRAEYMKGQLGPTIHTPKFDYEYRAYCVPSDFALALARMATEIDYTKFKPTTDRYEDDELHSVYNRIWSVLLNGLSTKWHQWDYWHRNSPAKSTGTATTATATGTGYPKAVGTTPAKSVETVENIAWLDEERERLDNWLRGRNPADGRDDQNDSEPVDFTPVVAWGDDDEAIVSSENPVIDALYNEIDVILEAQKKTSPIDHSKCEHAQTSREKAKCRARRRRDEEARIAELRQLIDEQYEDYKADASAGTSADPTEWKGFSWERKKS